MDLTKKEKAAFLKEFGQKVSSAIYDKFGSKAEFLRQTGINNVTLHQIITGGDTRLGTALKLAKILDLKVRDLLPEE